MQEQLLIRVASMDDLDQLLELSILVGSGMTSMPSDRKSWVDKLERSIADFHRDQASGGSDIYFMVMEDLNTGTIVGSGAVYAGIGLERPFYSYKLATISASSEKLGLTVHTRTLSLVNDFCGATEIGSLFVRPEYRRDGIGKFLSRSRFLLLADFPERFDERVFAEMRGWLNSNTESPFWNALGQKFFGLSFQKADFISAVDGFQFISDLMPKYPVYVDLLPQDAQAVIGRPHDDAAGALRILEKEGFSYNGYVDIFDAGPTISAQLGKIRSVAQSEAVKLANIVKDTELESETSFIVSNARLPDYRLMRMPLAINEAGDVSMGANCAEAMDLSVGDKIRILKERMRSKRAATA
jgi:arginine N-succinyltransferase